MPPFDTAPSRLYLVNPFSHLLNLVTKPLGHVVTLTQLLVLAHISQLVEAY